ncbi:MAG: ABC transporter permease [Lachnospiraceae bacterium]|nr:ABC transporter permease [Lachnospiraceae bacterium]
MKDDKSSRHRGRCAQTLIYLGKLFRMFIFQNDWKLLPMSAIIAGLVSFAVGGNLFKTMEGTLTGAFALSCVCIWNGFFNSIQVICRERAIVKREHRAGMHISSYITAHMIYQALLCAAQAAITIQVCRLTEVAFPEKCLFTSMPLVDMGITIFLATYCADMLALMVSSFAHTTTAAMTVMPFLLIVQLLFSGSFFSLPANVMPLSNLTISKWGLTAICAQGDYNSLPMVSIWNSAVKMKDVEVEGEKPLLEVLQYIERNDLRDTLMMETASYNQKPEYDYDPFIVLKCWGWLLLWTLVYVCISVISLEFIDRDKR